MYGIYLICKEESTKQKLLGIFDSIQKQNPHFEFDFIVSAKLQQDSINPNYDNNLVFYQADSKDLMSSRDAINSFIPLAQSRPYQFVLLCSEKYDYIELALQFKFGNLLLENNFDTSMIWAITKKLLLDDFFGIKPFFPNGYPHYHKTKELVGEQNRESILSDNFSPFLDTLKTTEKAEFSSAFHELMVNALSYAVQGITTSERDSKELRASTTLTIPDNKSLAIEIAQDDEKWALSITDLSGSLSLSRVLEKIRRHTSIGEELPQGLEDSTGRGLFMLSRQTRIIINILRGVKTQIIVMKFNESRSNHYQSLIINERQP